MMNLPFKLRERTGFCIPKGPTINKAQTILFMLEGNSIQFRAPRHSPCFKSDDKITPKRVYDFSDETFRSYSDDFVLNDTWKHLAVLYRSWGFYGPWFTGPQAELSLYIDVLKPTQPKSDVSFFHPRAFEGAVGDFLTVRYSKDKDEGIPYWMAPMHWTVMGTLPCVAARMGVYPVRDTNYGGNISEHLFFPVGDHYLVHFIFSPSLLVNEYWQEREKEVDPTPVNQLLNGIIDSLKVTLSPEAQAQQARALEGLMDTSLTPTFPPLKWTDDGADGQNQTYQQLQNS